jgi:hypothetical protein
MKVSARESVHCENDVIVGGTPTSFVETKAIRDLSKRMTQDNTLHLVTNAEVFDAICESKLNTDFREFKTYWTKRIEGKKHSYFHFRLGYSKDGPSVIAEANGSERITLSDPRAQSASGPLRNAKALEGRHLPSAATTEVYILNIGRTIFVGQYNDLKQFIDAQKVSETVGVSAPKGEIVEDKYRLFDAKTQQVKSQPIDQTPPFDVF